VVTATAARTRSARASPAATARSRRAACSYCSCANASSFARDYSVGKGTVNKVLRVLADEGLVRVVPSWGTFRM